MTTLTTKPKPPKESSVPTTATLLTSCDDRPGLVASLSQLLFALVLRGHDVEQTVLSRAVAWHLDGRVLVYDNKTIVFD